MNNINKSKRPKALSDLVPLIYNLERALDGVQNSMVGINNKMNRMEKKIERLRTIKGKKK